MNNIQKLISELKVRRESHQKNRFNKDSDYEKRCVYYGKMSECDFLIQKLTLLLNAETQDNGQKQAEHNGNAM